MKKLTPSQSKAVDRPVRGVNHLHVLPTIACFAVGAFAAYKMNTTPPRPPEPVFIATQSGEHKMYVNTQKIRWMQQDIENKCFHVCTDEHGCFLSPKIDDKYSVCEKDHPKSYRKLDKLVKTSD